MSVLSLLFVMAVILAGACVQSALGFGTTMITMGFLPLIMEYSKAMGLSIFMVSISTVYISVKYRDSIQWSVMLPVLIPTMVICGIVNILSAKVSSDSMYLLLGIMFVAVSIFSLSSPTGSMFVRHRSRERSWGSSAASATGCLHPADRPRPCIFCPPRKEKKNTWPRSRHFCVSII